MPWFQLEILEERKHEPQGCHDSPVVQWIPPSEAQKDGSDVTGVRLELSRVIDVPLAAQSRRVGCVVELIDDNFLQDVTYDMGCLITGSPRQQLW